MPRRNVRVEVPRHSPNKLIYLNERIIKRHEELGDDSPLKSLDMDQLKDNIEQAIELRGQAREKHAEAEALNEEARLLLGIDKGQNCNTPGTVYYEDTSIRNLLLLVHRGMEEQLSTYGFNVVISLSKMPKRKKKIKTKEKKNEEEQPAADEPPRD